MRLINLQDYDRLHTAAKALVETAIGKEIIVFGFPEPNLDKDQRDFQDKFNALAEVIGEN